VVDVLSWKHQFKVVYVGETKLQKEVRLGSRRDEFAKEVRQNIQNGVKSHFHLRSGLLWYKQNRLYVLQGKMRDVILTECHDGLLAGHGGAKRHTTFLKKTYYWPNMKDNAKEYVKFANKIRHLTRSKHDCCNLCLFLKGHGKVCPWISW
jgi:hypothetical protein